MLQLTYISTAAIDLAPSDVDAILETSRRNNARVGVSGLLLFDGVRFLQALEGEAVAVRAVYERIRADKRHRATVVLSERTVDAHEFGDWSMAYERGGNSAGAGTLLQQIDALVGDAPGSSTRALFRSFARVARQVPA